MPYPDQRVTQAQAYKVLFEIQAALPNDTFVLSRDPNFSVGGDFDIYIIGSVAGSGQDVAQILYMKSIVGTAGKYVTLSNGYPAYVSTVAAAEPAPFVPPSGAGLIAQQGTGEALFGGKINGGSGSYTEILSGLEKGLADIRAKLATDGRN